MERLDYRVSDFQTPLLSDIPSNSEYSNHIHRSIDTLRSLTDRATLNITLASQDTQNQQRFLEQRLCASSPTLNQNEERNLTQNGQIGSRHGLSVHQKILDRISPEALTNEESQRILANHQRHFLDTSQRILERDERVLDLQQRTSIENEYQQRLSDFNNKPEYSQQRSGTPDVFRPQQREPNNAQVKYEHRSPDTGNNVYGGQQRVSNLQIKYEYGVQHQDNDFSQRGGQFDSNGHLDRRLFSSKSDDVGGTAADLNQSGMNAGMNSGFKNSAATGGVNNMGQNGGASFSNSSPSSPGTPISVCNEGNSCAQEGEKVFGSKADLQLHTQMHMREAKPYKCSQCCKAFANSSYLSQHTRIHLGIKPYRCEICQRKFTQLSHLQQHIRTHTGDKPYKCRHPGCQKAFSQLSNLQSHSRCHQTDKPYKCNSCYKCFSDEPSLLEHIPKHKESKHLKTHICQYCGKSYTQETYLQKHMQKHSERVDKRPPITNAAAGGPLGGLNRNLLAAVSSATLESAYWSKLSPDSMSTLDLERLEYHNHHNPALAASNAAALLIERNGGPNLNLLERSNTNPHLDPHRAFRPQHADENLSENPNRTYDAPPSLKNSSSGVDRNNSNSSANNHENNIGGNTTANNMIGEDLVVGHRHTPTNSENPSTVPAGANSNNSTTYGNNPDVNKSGYEISISRSVSNSAFTPISGINHLNNLNLNHHMSRPYLYDALSFQNKDLNLNLNKSSANSNSFPNQLISLHQIRNYAHQPSSLGSSASEGLLGLKDK